jgi:hypothetical protein
MNCRWRPRSQESTQSRPIEPGRSKPWRAQAAEFAQLLYGDGLIQAGQDLLDALESLATASFRTGVGNGSGVARHRESQRRTGLT